MRTRKAILRSGLLVAVLSILNTGCKKSESGTGCTVTCQNGGSCINNVCDCPAGYEGTSCETLSRDKLIGTYSGYHVHVNSIGKDSSAANVSISAVAASQTQVQVVSGTYINQIFSMNKDGSFGAELPSLTYTAGYNSTTHVLYINVQGIDKSDVNFISATKQ